MQQPLPEHFYTMLQELQAIDFVLVELTLYLDTHPLDVQPFSSTISTRSNECIWPGVLRRNLVRLWPMATAIPGIPGNGSRRPGHGRFNQ